MRAGALRHRLQIQMPVEARDDIGGYRQVWMSGGDVWGAIEPIKGRELYEAQSIEGRLSHKILLRGLVELDPRWRLVWLEKDRAFQLYSVRDLGERHRTIECLAWEILD
jgi:SPP1 family predicted phage head-tail adaptor